MKNRTHLPFGSTWIRWITPELCSLAVRRSALPKPPQADEDLHFQEGDEVEMRDVHGAWQPALVTAVASFNSASIPAGSLTVCLQGDARNCTVIPEMFGKVVRKPVASAESKSTDGAGGKDDVEQWNPDTYLQNDKERSDGSVGHVSSMASTCKMDDSTAGQCRSNAGGIQKVSSHQSISKDEEVSRCQSDPPESVKQIISTPLNSPRQLDSAAKTDGISKTSSDNEEVNKNPGVSGLSGLSPLKDDDLPLGKDAADKDDAMSKSPSDGTTASGQTPRPSVSASPSSASPCASPATMPQPAPRHMSATFLDTDDQRPPSPAASVHSQTVRPTVSLQIPDLEQSQMSQPNSPSTTPRSCRSRAPWKVFMIYHDLSYIHTCTHSVISRYVYMLVAYLAQKFVIILKVSS